MTIISIYPVKGYWHVSLLDGNLTLSGPTNILSATRRDYALARLKLAGFKVALGEVAA
jgi:hypothetical protein